MTGRYTTGWQTRNLHLQSMIIQLWNCLRSMQRMKIWKNVSDNQIFKQSNHHEKSLTEYSPSYSWRTTGDFLQTLALLFFESVKPVTVIWVTLEVVKTQGTIHQKLQGFKQLNTVAHARELPQPLQRLVTKFVPQTSMTNLKVTTFVITREKFNIKFWVRCFCLSLCPIKKKILLITEN